MYKRTYVICRGNRVNAKVDAKVNNNQLKRLPEKPPEKPLKKPPEKPLKNTYIQEDQTNIPEIEYIDLNYDTYDHMVDLDSEYKSYDEAQIRRLLGTCGINRLVTTMHKKYIYSMIPILTEYDQRVLYDYLRKRESFFKRLNIT